MNGNELFTANRLFIERGWTKRMTEVLLPDEPDGLVMNSHYRSIKYNGYSSKTIHRIEKSKTFTAAMELKNIRTKRFSMADTMTPEERREYIKSLEKTWNRAQKMYVNRCEAEKRRLADEREAKHNAWVQAQALKEERKREIYEANKKHIEKCVKNKANKWAGKRWNESVRELKLNEVRQAEINRIYNTQYDCFGNPKR